MCDVFGCYEMNIWGLTYVLCVWELCVQGLMC